MSELDIIQRLIGVMEDIGTVGKNRDNTFDNYKFRGIDDIYNAGDFSGTDVAYDYDNDKNDEMMITIWWR